MLDIAKSNEPSVVYASTSLQFTEAIRELGALLSKPGCPRDTIDGALKIIDRVDERFFVKMPLSPTTLTGKIDDALKVSDQFLRYIAAFRAGDWPQVRIIEHEGIS